MTTDTSYRADSSQISYTASERQEKEGYCRSSAIDQNLCLKHCYKFNLPYSIKPYVGKINMDAYDTVSQIAILMQFKSIFSMSKLIYFKLVGLHRFKFIEYI